MQNPFYKRPFVSNSSSEGGATLIEFALVSGLIVFSLLITIYLFILVSFTNGVSHRLQLGVKIAQSDPDNIPDIYHSAVNSTEYTGQFAPWRENLLQKVEQSDISSLGNLVYEFREIAHFDELGNGSNEEPNVNTCLLLPGGACKVYSTKGSYTEPGDNGRKYNWYVHPQICPIDAGVPCNTTNGARRRISTETLPELLRNYPAVFASFPYLKAYNAGELSPILATGFLLSGRDAIVPPSPSPSPSDTPTESPSESPSATSSVSATPSGTPSQSPSGTVSQTPSASPSSSVSRSPSSSPTSSPTGDPTVDPTIDPSQSPTDNPTVDPTGSPTSSPTGSPTVDPTIDPSQSPTDNPTNDPTGSPTGDPTGNPSATPTDNTCSGCSNFCACNPGVYSPSDGCTCHGTCHGVDEMMMACDPWDIYCANVDCNPSPSPSVSSSASSSTSPTASSSPSGSASSSSSTSPTASSSSSATAATSASASSSPATSPSDCSSPLLCDVQLFNGYECGSGCSRICCLGTDTCYDSGPFLGNPACIGPSASPSSSSSSVASSSPSSSTSSQPSISGSSVSTGSPSSSTSSSGNPSGSVSGSASTGSSPGSSGSSSPSASPSSISCQELESSGVVPPGTCAGNTCPEFTCPEIPGVSFCGTEGSGCWPTRPIGMFDPICHVENGVISLICSPVGFRNEPCEPGPGNSACGQSCCTSLSIPKYCADASISLCCLNSQFKCGDACCDAGRICDEATGTCCASGSAPLAGGGCCPAGKAYLDPTTGAPSCCNGGGQMCGTICCAASQTCGKDAITNFDTCENPSPSPSPVDTSNTCPIGEQFCSAPPLAGSICCPAGQTCGNNGLGGLRCDGFVNPTVTPNIPCGIGEQSCAAPPLAGTICCPLGQSCGDNGLGGLTCHGFVPPTISPSPETVPS